jgi:DNA gyrase subunit A
MKSIRDTDELMLITQKGKIVRTGISEMRIIGRATQGVRVIAMKGNDLLVAIAKVMPDDEASEEAGDEASDGADTQAPETAPETAPEQTDTQAPETAPEQTPEAPETASE